MAGTPAAENPLLKKVVSRVAILSAHAPRDAAEIGHAAEQAFDRHEARRPIVTMEYRASAVQLEKPASFSAMQMRPSTEFFHAVSDFIASLHCDAMLRATSECFVSQI